MVEDYYKILGIKYPADAKSIKKAFHQLAKKYHPDKNPQNSHAAERFKNISKAYVTLSDPEKKSKYDLKYRYGAYAPYVKKSQARASYSRRPPVSRNFYRQQVVFSRQARVLGMVSIIAIILTVAVTTIYLTRYNAEFDFQKGLANYHNERYSAAYFNLKESLSPLNPYLAAAYLLMAEITYHQQDDIELTRTHIRNGYNASPSDSINARLLYLEGKIDYQIGDHINAYRNFRDATFYLPNFDSATYQMGEIDLFIFARFDKALTHFQRLTESNPANLDALLATAYCHQKLGEHQKAITEIDRYMQKQQEVGMAHYIKAKSAQALGLSEISCANYLEAHRLQVPPALDSLNSYCGMSLTR